MFLAILFAALLTAPVAAIFFWVYWSLPAVDNSEEAEAKRAEQAYHFEQWYDLNDPHNAVKIMVLTGMNQED